MDEINKIKKKFKELIILINKNKKEIILSKICKNNIKELIKKWNKKNKIIKDFFIMEQNHLHITEEIIKNKKIKNLWIEYIKLVSDLIIELIKYKNINYYKFCNNIKKKIQIYKPNINFIFRINPFSNFLQIIFGNRVISVPDNITLEDVKRHLDKCINFNKSKENKICKICLTGSKELSCLKCAKFFCKRCYLNLFKMGEGIVKCPFCRYTVGIKNPGESLIINIELLKKIFGFN
jgi:hypothetical protein